MYESAERWFEVESVTRARSHVCLVGNVARVRSVGADITHR